MKKLVILVLLAMSVFLGCDSDNGVSVNTIIGSGNAITVEKDFTDFVRIDISNAFETTITQADTYSVFVSVDDNILEYLNVGKDEDLLRIYLDYGQNYEKTTLKAEITLPDIEELSLSGACTASLAGFDFDHGCGFKLSGASMVSGAMNIGSGNLELILSGASRVTLYGSGNDVVMTASGASVVELGEFPCHDAHVDLSGASLATITVSGELNARVSGVSTLRYYGRPILGNISVSGASTIQNLNP